MMELAARSLCVIALASLAVGAAASGSVSGAEAKTTRPTSRDADKLEEVSFSQDGRQRSLEGRIVVEAADGGVLLQTADGVLWTIERDELRTRRQMDSEFKPLSPQQLSERLIAELPAGFRSYTTPHYVVCYDTSRAYAQWTGSLLERLYKAFTSYWEGQGMELREPEFPLAVFVFASRQTYDKASREDLPGGTGNIIGFYSLRSNRVNMFDLTGAESLRDTSTGRQAGANRRGSMREINQMLSQPAAVPLVSTVVHEATHQIAFNCGMQTRYADIPLWLCEGMAVYFEAPDLASTRGWRGIGRVNYPRLETFRDNLSSWHHGSLDEMLGDSRRFRDPRTAVDAYADAWALNYYLIKYEPKAYTEYLKGLSEKPPLVDDDPQTRLSEFRARFGDLDNLEQEFLKQMSRVK